MILIIKTNKEPLHDLEFVKPVEEVLKRNNKEFRTISYSEIKDIDFKKFNKIIITGTSLQDNQYLENLEYFDWIKKTDKSLLGICAGMQIISLAFGGEQRQKTEIDFYEEDFNPEFLGLKEKEKVYHMHKNYVSLPDKFHSYTKGIPQAIKHKEKEIYGTLFHPEVRNKKIIENFINV